MEDTLKQRVEVVLDTEVRPFMKQHEGDLEIADISDGILYVRLKGKCSGCPSSQMTVESLVKEEVMKQVEEIKDVQIYEVTDPDLLAFAKSILKI